MIYIISVEYLPELNFIIDTDELDEDEDLESEIQRQLKNRGWNRWGVIILKTGGV